MNGLFETEKLWTEPVMYMHIYKTNTKKIMHNWYLLTYSYANSYATDCYATDSVATDCYATDSVATDCYATDSFATDCHATTETKIQEVKCLESVVRGLVVTIIIVIVIMERISVFLPALGL
jgi:hypothetical protein